MEQEPYRPIKVVDLDIARPLTDLAMTDPKTGKKYGGVFGLVRRGTRPIKLIEFSFTGDILPASKLESVIGNDIDETAAISSAQGLKAGNEPFLSVIVATRDRAASLSRCLDSLLRQNYPAFDIIVVDSAPSSSATADMIAGRYAPTGRVRYVREDRPGLGRAHNIGVGEAIAGIAVFTDDDVIADPNWLAAIAANFDSNGKVGCVTGLILPAELETRAQFWTERHGGFCKGFERKIYDLQDHRPPGPLFPYTAGQFGSGANMAFSMEAIRRIGGFDPALGAGTQARGGDDLASFFAVVKAGYQLVYEPAAIVWHHHRREEEGIRRQAFGYGVGLGAYLTKLVIDEPSAALHLLRALPAGLAHILAPSSTKNRRLANGYPATLIWRERLGILAGVHCYLRSRATLKRGAGKPHRAAVNASPNAANSE